jgi:hypothetical protein
MPQKKQKRRRKPLNVPGAYQAFCTHREITEDWIDFTEDLEDWIAIDGARFGAVTKDQRQQLFEALAAFREDDSD